MLVRRSIGALGPAGGRCASCRRTPLAGERLHELESGRQLCQLCFTKLPDGKRIAVRSRRVHADERHVAAAPKVA